MNTSQSVNTNQSASNSNQRKLPRFVVMKNGSIALFNLGHNPIILYHDQWMKLSNLIRKDVLDKYVARNQDRVKILPPRSQPQSEQPACNCSPNCKCGENCDCNGNCKCDSQNCCQTE